MAPNLLLPPAFLYKYPTGHPTCCLYAAACMLQYPYHLYATATVPHLSLVCMVEASFDLCV